MKSNVYRKSMALTIALFTILNFSFAQIYTESFNTAPTLIDYPAYWPGLYSTAEVTIGGSVYQFNNSYNDSWHYVSTGGVNNSANLLWEPASDAVITIQRKDLGAFTFYGAWLKYLSYTNSPYAPPWFTVTYNGSSVPSEVYGANTTVILNSTAEVTSVTISIHGLSRLNFDEIKVGPARPVITGSSINQYSNTTALFKGNVTSDGGSALTERGVVYNTTGSPTTADTKVVSALDTGTFSQNITGLTASTTYYVRGYATNGIGTRYTNDYSFTTAAPFVLEKTHSFNSGWSATSGQTSPFKKYVEGWDVTVTATGGSVGITRITSATGTSAAYEMASMRATSSTQPEAITSVSINSNTGDVFDLESFRFKYLSRNTNSPIGTFTVTGYKNGVAVDGAVASITGIAQATPYSYAYTLFDLSANDNFNSIDKFVVTPSNPAAGAVLSSLDFDAMVIKRPPANLPTVETLLPNTVSSTTASLAGTVTSNGSITTTSFDWGTTADLSEAVNIAATTGGTVSENEEAVSMAVSLTGLTESTTYYYRACATNSAGTVKGEIFSFNTMPPQTIRTEPFETFSRYQTNFSSGGIPFNLLPSHGFTIERRTGKGYNSSNQFVSFYPEGEISCSMKTDDGSIFTSKSIWIYLSSNGGTTPSDEAAITVYGKKDNDILFTKVIPAYSFNPNPNDPVTRGFSLIDFSLGDDYSNIDIDELQFEFPSAFNYIAVDNFTFASYSLLPLRLTSFSGQLVNKKSVLKWITDAEQNLAGFDIERATDAAAFSVIGHANAYNLQRTNNYNFTDAAPATGNNYYRLRMINSNGSFSYSNTVKITLNERSSAMVVSPNPGIGDFIYLANTGIESGTMGYIITDAVGRIVCRGNVSNSTSAINVATLPAGIYYLKLNNGRSSTIFRQ